MAIKLPKDVIGMCEEGRFKLTKFISNSRKVLATIPEERQHRKIKNQDLDMSDLAVERALGVHWNIENVYLGFKIQLKDKPQEQSGTLTLNLKYMTVMILKFVITWQ